MKIIVFKTILIGFILLINCHQDVSKEDEKVSSDIQNEGKNIFLLFNHNSQDSCLVKSDNLTYVKTNKKSTKIPYYQKRIIGKSSIPLPHEENSVIFTFCNYGSFVHTPKMKNYKIVKNDQYDFKTINNLEEFNTIKNGNIYIVEPHKDSMTVYEVKRVKHVKP